MIQSVSSVNVNNKVSATPIRKQSFGDSEYVQPKKRSAIGWAAGQFGTGAAVGLIYSAIVGGFEALSQNGTKLKLEPVLKNAGIFGAFWLATSLLFEGINASRRNKQR